MSDCKKKKLTNLLLIKNIKNIYNESNTPNSLFNV